jgi:uncharacterized protein YbaP (TraB family)
MAVVAGALAVGAAVSAQAPRKHFLWSVTGKAGATAYLLGSLHVLTPDFYPLPAPIEEAFGSSKVLVEEVDLDEASSPATALSLLGKAMYTDGTTLEQAVSKSTFEEVRKRAEKASLPVMALQRMKPWSVAITLAVPLLREAGFDASHGIDQHFFDRAKQAGMERRGLETVAYQLDRFDGLSPALQEAMLLAVIHDLDAQVANVKEVARAWAAGETGVIEKELLATFKESPEIYQRLLVERNRNWVPFVEGCLDKNERCFVVVGAAHLVGPDSLVVMLEKKGYKVEQR